MKRIVFAIIIAIASVPICLAAGGHADERFSEDVTITNSIVAAGEYENAVFVKNLTLINTIVRKEAFKKVVIVGDLTISGCTVANDAFAEMTLIGQQSVDDATVYFDDTSSSGNSGAVFYNDVVITDPVIADGAYSGSIFYGNLTIESTVVGNRAFSGAIVMGNLDVATTYAMNSSFSEIVVNGITTFDAEVVGMSAFQNATFNGKVTIADFSRLEYQEVGSYDYDEGAYVTTKVYNTFSGCHIAHGIELNCSGEIPARVFTGSSISGELTYSSNTTTFASYAFSGVTFGDLTINTTDIAPSMFQGAKSVKSLTFSQGVKTIGNSAFSGVKIDTLYKFPDALTDIGDYAFYNCGISGRMELPASGATLGKATFASNKITSVVIPAKTKSIPPELFLDCYNLTSMECESGRTLISIGTRAFMRCGFKEIILPPSITEIGEGAFYLVPADKIVLPENVTTVGTNAFERLEQREGGVLPSVSREILIPERAFLQLNGKYKNLDLSYTGICTFDKLFIWASEKAVLPKIMNNLSYYASWWGVQYLDGEGEIPAYMQNEAWPLDDPWVRDYLAQGYVYVPKGTKELLLAALAKSSRLSPSLRGLSEDHWIEIEMLDYPNYQMQAIGDLNGDGDVDGGDVSVALEMVLAGGLSDEQKSMADLNGDGDVDGGDVSILLEMVLSAE